MTMQKQLDALTGSFGDATETQAPLLSTDTLKLAELAEDQAGLQPVSLEGFEHRKPGPTQWYINPDHLIGDLNIS